MLEIVLSILGDIVSALASPFFNRKNKKHPD